MILKRFAGLFLLPFALLAGAPLAAKDARPGLFMRNGEAFIFRIESGQPVDVRVAGKDDKPAEGELKAELVGPVRQHAHPHQPDRRAGELRGLDRQG